MSPPPPQKTMITFQSSLGGQIKSAAKFGPCVTSWGTLLYSMWIVLPTYYSIWLIQMTPWLLESLHHYNIINVSQFSWMVSFHHSPSFRTTDRVELTLIVRTGLQPFCFHKGNVTRKCRQIAILFQAQENLDFVAFPGETVYTKQK